MGYPFSRSNIAHGSLINPGAGRWRLTTQNFLAHRGVLVRAGLNNTGWIAVGGITVTQTGVEATDGIILKAGEAVEIEINNPNKLYISNDAGVNNIYWLAI